MSNNPIFDPILSNIRSDDSDNLPSDIIKYDVFLDKVRLVDKNGGVYYDYILNMIRVGTSVNLLPPLTPNGMILTEDGLYYIVTEDFQYSLKQETT